MIEGIFAFSFVKCAQPVSQDYFHHTKSSINFKQYFIFYFRIIIKHHVYKMTSSYTCSMYINNIRIENGAHFKITKSDYVFTIFWIQSIYCGSILHLLKLLKTYHLVAQIKIMIIIILISITRFFKDAASTFLFKLQPYLIIDLHIEPSKQAGRVGRLATRHNPPSPKPASLAGWITLNPIQPIMGCG